MNSSDIKEVRKQLRTVAKELLPEVLTGALTEAVYTKLHNETVERLKMIEAQINQTLAQIDERQKTVQAFIMNQVTAASIPTPAPESKETA